MDYVKVFILPKALDFISDIYYIVENINRRSPQMGGDFSLAWDALQPLLITGFTIGVVLAVLFGAIKLGSQFAPWIIAFAALVWFFGG